MTFRTLFHDGKGTGAAEFALVLPLLLLFLFGIIDGGRWLWAFNQAEKATQVGARVAVVTNLVPGGYAVSWVGQPVNGVNLTQGDVIPAAALGTIKCTNPSGAISCTCETAPCPSPLTPFSLGGWNAIVGRMKFMYPPITNANVEVRYSGSGLGYAGDPSGTDISPLVEVRLRGLNFEPITFLTLKSVQAIPVARTSLTAEDLLGNQSN